MSARMVRSVRAATTGFAIPSTQTRVRRPSPRSSPRIGSRAKILSARAYFPKPRNTMRGSAGIGPVWAARRFRRGVRTSRLRATGLRPLGSAPLGPAPLGSAPLPNVHAWDRSPGRDRRATPGLDLWFQATLIRAANSLPFRHSHRPGRRHGWRFDGGMRVDPVLRAHRPLVVAASAVLPLVACGILALFRDSVANTNAALGLVLLVVAAASTGIRLAGIVAALSSAAGFDYFLTEPYNTLSISDRADIETAVLLLLVGAAVTEVALWGRREQARASQEQGYLDGVLSTAATVAAGRSSSRELIDQVCRQIVELQDLDDLAAH